MNPIRVFVVDDHTMFRTGLAATLAVEPQLLWVGEARNGAEALHLAPAALPDVVLVDMVMPGMDGAEVVTALRQRLGAARYVMLCCRADAEATRRAMEAGASCVLLKSVAAAELVAAIHTACRGGQFVSPELAHALAAHPPRRALGEDLTQRERELLVLMARGMANEDISARLRIAMPTVKFHVTNILAKLGVANRTAAVLMALRHRLVRLEPAELSV